MFPAQSQVACDVHDYHQQGSGESVLLVLALNHRLVSSDICLFADIGESLLIEWVRLLDVQRLALHLVH